MWVRPVAGVQPAWPGKQEGQRVREPETSLRRDQLLPCRPRALPRGEAAVSQARSRAWLLRVPCQQRGARVGPMPGCHVGHLPKHRGAWRAGEGDSHCLRARPGCVATPRAHQPGGFHSPTAHLLLGSCSRPTAAQRFCWGCGASRGPHCLLLDLLDATGPLVPRMAAGELGGPGRLGRGRPGSARAQPRPTVSGSCSKDPAGLRPPGHAAWGPNPPATSRTNTPKGTCSAEGVQAGHRGACHTCSSEEPSERGRNWTSRRDPGCGWGRRGL